MKKNLHQKFINDIRVSTEEIQDTQNLNFEVNEEEIIRKLEQKFDELFGPLDNDD